MDSVKIFIFPIREQVRRVLVVFHGALFVANGGSNAVFQAVSAAIPILYAMILIGITVIPIRMIIIRIGIVTIPIGIVMIPIGIAVIPIGNAVIPIGNAAYQTGNAPFQPRKTARLAGEGGLALPHLGVLSGFPFFRYIKDFNQLPQRS
uniref:Uncharacterized protein n=1 Tax=Candidatus Kentrum sp. TUN TaxID=2126343 RepID=A0A450ZIF6_9GAMM|nr:MAG: hypothetical protein BECKTUN1418F_GA0071002_102317 [Candidatus Kentron sp. TUN]VFK55605.1 MAG: hypothetical protein BECKTUN1418E_GA0071001_10315 [Candidatus Kentron sp. TUN]